MGTEATNPLRGHPARGIRTTKSKTQPDNTHTQTDQAYLQQTRKRANEGGLTAGTWPSGRRGHGKGTDCRSARVLGDAQRRGAKGQVTQAAKRKQYAVYGSRKANTGLTQSGITAAAAPQNC